MNNNSKVVLLVKQRGGVYAYPMSGNGLKEISQGIKKALAKYSGITALKKKLNQPSIYELAEAEQASRRKGSGKPKKKSK